MTYQQHKPENTTAGSATAASPDQMPEPASDLLEFSKILRRLAEHLASTQHLDQFRHAVEQQDVEGVRQLARDAAIPGEVRLNEDGRVVLVIRLGPVDGVIGLGL